jgi:antitoxin Phd
LAVVIWLTQTDFQILMKQSPRNPRAAKTPTEAALGSLPAWKLQDAKAHFRQVVREAREQGPQRVTVHGKDAVVILSAEDYARLTPASAQPSLHALLSSSQLRGLDFEHRSVRSLVRDVEL